MFDSRRLRRFSTAAMLAFLAVIVAPAAAGQCPPNLMGYWPLDGDGREVINGTAGYPMGPFVSFADGKVGQAASLSGPSYIDAGANGTGTVNAAVSGFGGDQLTFTAWVFPTTSAGGAILTARTLCTAGNWQFYGYGQDLGLYAMTWKSPAGDMSSHMWSNVGAPVGEWSHVAASYDGSEADFYLNGVWQQTVTASGPGGVFNATPNNVQIGWDGCSSYWQGLLDEVAVYNVALSAAQIEAQYLNSMAGIALCGIPPSDQVAELVADVIGLNLQEGITNSLDAKLTSALDALGDLNANNDGAAINKLQAFINAVNAQRGNKISEADADGLVDAGQAIIDQLTGT